MNENLFFINAKTPDPICEIFTEDTRHPGVIHARVLNLLSHGQLDEAVALVESRLEAVQPSTYKMLERYMASCSTRAA